MLPDQRIRRAIGNLTMVLADRPFGA